MTAEASQSVPSRPDPRLAWWLSVLLPGAGQAYVGQLVWAPVFAAAWGVSLFGMLDVLTTFRGSPYQVLFGLCAVLFGGGSWVLSPCLARRRAERMTAHAALFLGIGLRPFLRCLFVREWPSLLLALAFALLTFGHLTQARQARGIAEQVMWWWPYEILGSAFLVVYQVFLEGLSDRLARPLPRLVLLVTLFAALAVTLHLVFRFPLGVLAVSGLIILPGFIPVLTFGSGKDRIRFFYRAGRSACTLVLSFFAVGFLASLAEGHGVHAVGRSLFEGSIMISWGAVYFALRAFLEALNTHAAALEGESDDPRWGG